MIVPVAARLGVPIAAPLDSYPALPFRGEDLRAVVRVEGCACGGSIVQWPGQDPADVVSAHNRLELHQAWRRSVEGRGEPGDRVDNSSPWPSLSTRRCPR